MGRHPCALPVVRARVHRVERGDGSTHQETKTGAGVEPTDPIQSQTEATHDPAPEAITPAEEPTPEPVVVEEDKPKKKISPLWKLRFQKKKPNKSGTHVRSITKRHGIVGRKWTWGYINTFQPVEKWTKQGRLTRPLPRDTIAGCVYYAMRRVKKGTDLRILEAALDEGLAALTVQDMMPRVQRELRVMAKLGVIKRTKSQRKKPKRRKS
jgi:hypothetical protein